MIYVTSRNSNERDTTRLRGVTTCVYVSGSWGFPLTPATKRPESEKVTEIVARVNVLDQVSHPFVTAAGLPAYCAELHP